MASPPHRRAAAFGSLGALLLAAGCTTPPATAPGPQPLVLATTFPLTLFSQAVAAGCARVEPLSRDAADPHHGQARPGDLARLSRARVLVSNGLGLEDPLEPGIAAAAGPALVRIDSSRGLTPLRSATGVANPHVWLDPQRAQRQVQAIRDGLVAADPACRRRYTANATAYSRRLQQLDAELAARLAPYAGRRFVVSHDLAPYLADRYRLRAEPLVPDPDRLPSPADLQRVSAVARAGGLRALLVEPGAHEGDLPALARDLRLRLLPLDPLETPPPGPSPGPDHYLTTMRRNADALVSAFGG